MMSVMAIFHQQLAGYRYRREFRWIISGGLPHNRVTGRLLAHWLRKTARNNATQKERTGKVEYMARNP